ncbi:hypothetical protein [Candidatus Nitrosocosmicus franklandus]|uniref:Uncharacterized protein n=1 Tax=Candidatus Nitrosocosmicus franklandianus TaxID=1798806 RepID=A0A484IDW6_9ARCH|nr:hypothetical protein [Candidatus Nitrosocosmicus franklandus]VFJ15331.1 protein of unknown function [Candidatus Nitrosocosmicus franklandus]
MKFIALKPNTLKSKKSSDTSLVQCTSTPRFVKNTRNNPIPNEIPVINTIKKLKANLVFSIVIFKEFIFGKS